MTHCHNSHIAVIVICHSFIVIYRHSFCISVALSLYHNIIYYYARIKAFDRILYEALIIIQIPSASKAIKSSENPYEIKATSPVAIWAQASVAR